MKNIENEKIKKYFKDNFIFFRYLWASGYDLAMHIGFWNDNTKNKKEALINENKYIAQKLCLDENDLVLDLGCGMGGTAIWFAEKYRSKIIGVDFVDKNIELAKKTAKLRGVGELTDFKVGDFNKAICPDMAFNKIYSIEGFSYSTEKTKFLKNCFEQLKNDGILIIADYFCSSDKNKEDDEILKKWYSTWAYPNLISPDELVLYAKKIGFFDVEFHNKTDLIMPSSQILNKVSLKTYPLMKFLYKLKLTNELPEIDAVKEEVRLFRDGLLIYGVVILKKKI